MHVQVNRLVAGTIHEILVLFEKRYKNEVEAETTTGLLPTLSSEHQHRWQRLVKFARRKRVAIGGMPGRLDNFFRDVRNGVSYHYADGEQLRKGYDRHFDANSQDSAKRYAQYCKHDDPFRSRFFFADAAAQASVAGIAINKEVLRDPGDETVNLVAAYIMATLNPVLFAFLESRSRNDLPSA